MSELTRRAFAAHLPAAAALAVADSAEGALPGAAAGAGEAARFEAIWRQEWTWRQTEFPDDHDESVPIAPYLPDVGEEAQARRLTVWRAVSTQLATIDPATLDPEGKVNLAVYRDQIEALLAAQSYKDWQAPFNSDTSFWGEMTWVAHRSFHTQADYRNYVARLAQTPRYFDQQIANMRSELARGFAPPKVTLEGREASVGAVVKAPSPKETEFYLPFASMPPDFPAEVKNELTAAGAAVIADSVIPAHARLLSFLKRDYLPRCRKTISAAALPDGAAWYRSKIREFTTLDLSPDEIHQIGLAEVGRIRAEMDAVIAETKFMGDFAAFLHFLRTDPRFYVATPQALLDRAAWTAKVFDGKAKDWFGRLPRARFAIRPVPAEWAPFYTAGRGGLNVYLVNTYDLPSRPLYALPALTLHESAPGHAFQIPLALETTGQPDFRRKGYISAYGEGWAVYCERLGDEMGIYETQYERFGMLSYQAWRAARLVVDTGLHASGWRRDQALAYLSANTALSSREVATEVDRYISWPGQALSYYLGAMAIAKAREKARTELGQKFDIRAFHDAVLQLGSVPLAVVEERIDRFIREGGVSPYPPDA